MNQRLALGLSIVGVLTAGSAAALVNTQILSAGAEQAVQAPSPVDAAVAPIVLTVDPNTGVVMPPSAAVQTGSSAVPDAAVPRLQNGTAPAATDGSAALQSLAGTSGAGQLSAPTTSMVAEATTTTIPTDSTTTSTVGPPSTVDYRVGSAGVVTLDTAGDVLSVMSVRHEVGWTVAQALQVSPSAVQITFRSASMEVVFRASLAFGVVTPSVDSISLEAPPAAAGSGSYVDDDDGYDDGYDDHDDDGYDDGYDDHDDDDHDDEGDDEDHDDEERDDD